MNFSKINGPFIKDNNSTNKMMLHLLIALLPIILFSFIKNGVIPYKNDYIGFIEMFRPLYLIIIGSLSSLLFEVFYFKVILKKKNIKELIKNSYSILPGLFMILVLPISIGIPYIIIGAFFATFVGKFLFGGFGKNVFNPALIGVLIITAFYGSTIGTYHNKMELDTIATATPLSQNIEGAGTITELTSVYSFNDLIIGNHPGSLGETSAILIIVAFIYLSIMKVIKWKIPVFYVSTVFAITSIIGAINGHDLSYPLYQILTGGLLFGAVFMATDPVTSPTTSIGQMAYGIFLGILTVIVRYLTPYPEGVLTAILTMNTFVFIIDKIGYKSRFNFKKASSVFLISWFLITSLGYYIGKELKTYSPFEIISKVSKKEGTEYIVKRKGYIDFIKAKVVIKNSKVIDLEILEQKESYYVKIEDAKYIEKFKQKDFKKIDTVSGATRTSTAIKDLVERVVNDYNRR